MHVTIEHDEAASRFRFFLHEEVAGLADYVRDGDRWVFTHTEVRPEFSGRGLAGRLVRHAFEHVIDDGGTIVPVCPYVANYARKHPEFHDHVEEPRGM